MSQFDFLAFAPARGLLYARCMVLEPKLIMVAVCSAIIGGLVVAAWNSRGSYEQCIIDSMRGQPDDMSMTIIGICADRYDRK